MIKCKECGKLFDERIGVCPVCGTVPGSEGLEQSEESFGSRNSRVDSGFSCGMIRCKRCGASIFEGATECSVCHAPLPVVQDPVVNDAEDVPAGDSSDFVCEMPDTCPNCGYPLRCGSAECPECGWRPDPSRMEDASSCGAHDDNSCEANDGSAVSEEEVQCGTDMEAGFVLEECDGNGVAVRPVRFKGTEVMVGRADLDGSDLNISRKHAEFRFENGKWYVSDKSTYHRTYIVVESGRELKDGDLIMMGDKLFRFKA